MKLLAPGNGLEEEGCMATYLIDLQTRQALMLTFLMPELSTVSWCAETSGSSNQLPSQFMQHSAALKPPSSAMPTTHPPSFHNTVINSS
jgi:hypothetical protein